MRLLLDQGLAPSAAALLRERGFEAIHVAEINMEKANDRSILDRARAEERVCVTLDHDFHAHLAISGQGRPSVILLRVEHCAAAEQATLIQNICQQCAAALSDGAAISADRATMRVRRLPLR